ncbi:hypothetical protein KV097_17895 [Mumia sp. zg.B17]|uniref:hypothetical protein n=1 Tax=unclassified Mumia TaxID=2621872 RepID=UPI001C6E9E29|nr:MULTISPECIES: hypothetical protein [unclassified Mumia]MBW9207813.1 hypothetical protein [Mumia sp. zg.B17]MDD9349136.1 hypothetical protein [Mumia sp.]
MVHDLALRARTPLALGATSVLALALGALWLLEPSSSPYEDTDGAVSLLSLLPDVVAPVLVLLGGVLGLATSVALATASRSPVGRRGLIAAAATVALVLSVFCMDSQLIAFIGYFCAMTIPVIAVVLLVAALRRSMAARATALVATGLVTWWGIGSGSFAPDTIGELVRTLGEGYARVGFRPWILLGLAALTVQWMSASLAWAAPYTARLQQPSTRLDRITTIATVVAAVCPLPYVLLRSTWLFPDALFTGPLTPADLDPAMRLWGLLLGAAALGGSILTVGLLRPWGRVFPAWMPSLRGRTVPVAAAAVPGYAVAFVLTATAPSIVLLSIEQAADGDTAALWMLGVLPFWAWGPALAVAVWGYVRSRRAAGAQTTRPTRETGKMAA